MEENIFQELKSLKEELMLKNTFISEYRLMQEYKRWYKNRKEN